MNQDNQIILACDDIGKFDGEYIPKEVGHTGKGKRHLAITVLLFNSRGEVLLQRRKHKIFDDVWDYGATHPLHLEDHDESFEESTERCLEREYKIPRGTVVLKNIGTFNYFSEYKNGLCENEHCALLIGEYNDQLHLNPEIGYSYKWVEKDEFLDDINNNPQDYSPWAIAALPLLFKNGFFDNKTHDETEELLSVVDEENRVIGRAKRGEIYEKGLLHRAVNIIINNSRGDIYLQQRSEKKKAFPSYWDLSCAEHLKPGETHLEAAYRGLNEELSIKADLDLSRPIHLQKSEFQSGEQLIKEYELVETYKAVYDGEIFVNKDEVVDGKFFSVEEIREMLKENQQLFTPWFLEEWRFLEINQNI